MPRVGDTMEAYCKTCDRETTWLFKAFFRRWWECMGCGTKRYLH
jgi:hypothetical protein